MLPLRPLPNLQRFAYDAEQRLIQVIQTQLDGRLRIEYQYSPWEDRNEGVHLHKKTDAPVAGGSEW